MEITKTPEERQAEFTAIAAQYAAARDFLLQKKNVVDVGVGYKETNGSNIEVMCLLVYVKHKVAATDLSDEDFIPPVVNGILTDVMEIENISAQTEQPESELSPGINVDKERPLMGGIQIDNTKSIKLTVDGKSVTKSGVGTLGCFVNRNADGALALLTNDHVLALGGTVKGDPVYQPAVHGCCCCCYDDRTIAHIEPGVRPPAGKTGTVDAAIALIRKPALGDRVFISNIIKGLGEYKIVNGVETLSGDNAPIKGVQPMELYPGKVVPPPGLSSGLGFTPVIPGALVRKVGRTTGRTLGVVMAVNIPTGMDGLSYVECMAIEPVDKTTEFSMGGDSGSVIVNKDNKVVGLLMGGRSFDKSKGEVPTPNYPDRTYACNIHNVLKALDISIYSPPEARITHTLQGDGMSAPLSVEFSAVSSSDEDGTMLAYMWWIGDPNDDGIMSSNTAATFTYEFNVPGTYEVTLTVMDEHGMSDRTAIKINVAMPALGNTPGSVSSTASAERNFKPQQTGLEILEARLKAAIAGSEISIVIDTLKTEVLHLVNHNRKVTLAWRRKMGPSFLAQFLKSVETPGNRLVKEINGVSLQSLLQSMAVVLEEEGSISLREAVQKYSLLVFNAVHEHDTVDALLASYGKMSAHK